MKDRVYLQNNGQFQYCYTIFLDKRLHSVKNTRKLMFGMDLCRINYVPLINEGKPCSIS